jgi:dTDP-4-amino-4,6-dideoxygalactose transaminase
MKLTINDLKIFGGAQAFKEKLHVGCPNIGKRARLLERINDILDKKWLTNKGPYVREFEINIARMLGVKHCIAMCNGTVALEIAIRAAGLSREVIVPSFTFVATVHALQWQGITPVFCDIDPLTYNIDPLKVEEAITPNTTGILGVHLWGRPCNTDALSEIAHSHKLKLLFDSAHAFGCSYKDAMVGNFGNAEVFSFHATKYFNTFEGGAVVTNDDELAEKIQLMNNFGFVDYDKVVYIGTNGKMNEVSAAMGLTSMESKEEFIAINYQNYQQYREQLAEIPGVTMLTFNEQEKCNYQYIILEIDEAIAHISRDHLKDILWAENIIARRYFYPGCHRMEPYRSLFPWVAGMLPQTEQLASRVLSLPTGTTIGIEDIRKICQVIRLVVTHGREILERWTPEIGQSYKV